MRISDCSSNVCSSDLLALHQNGNIQVSGKPRATRFTDLPVLRWPSEWLGRHQHHHHRFGTEAPGPGAEVEASRGCPYHCSFCAAIDFRDPSRRRALDIVLPAIARLIAPRATSIYFLSHIFLSPPPPPSPPLDPKSYIQPQTPPTAPHH